MKKFIVAIDQGTTSTRSILFDLKGNPLFISQKEFDNNTYKILKKLDNEHFYNYIYKINSGLQIPNKSITW